ncbi:MAG: M60 family metallopeptidase [Bacteroidaceae bacterium]|nr:M60 family metallopeptidase [Bacteroidaceae bacterium]
MRKFRLFLSLLLSVMGIQMASAQIAAEYPITFSRTGTEVTGVKVECSTLSNEEITMTACTNSGTNVALKESDFIGSSGLVPNVNGNTSPTDLRMKFEINGLPSGGNFSIAKVRLRVRCVNASGTDNMNIDANPRKWDVALFTGDEGTNQIASMSQIEISNGIVDETNGDWFEAAVTGTQVPTSPLVLTLQLSAQSATNVGSFFCLTGIELILHDSTIEEGKVYCFDNVGYSKSLGATSHLAVGGRATDHTALAQQWYVESIDGKYFKLRSMSCGNYLKGNGQSSSYSLTNDPDEEHTAFELHHIDIANGIVALRPQGYTGNYEWAHIDGSSNIVGWENGNDHTQWTIAEVEYTEDQLAANWERISKLNPDEETIQGYQEALNNLFSDAACTTLKKSFASQQELEADADYLALPETLRLMAIKVYTNGWAEDNYDNEKNGWDSDYAKKYRVQLYEPYSEKEKAAAVLRINAHSNLNNPTGLFANSNQALYVMVEGTIDPDALLYIDSYTGHGKPGGNTSGVQLKEGLNVIPYFTDGNNIFINYNVKTFDNSNGEMGTAAKYRKLSEYPTLKIHIEGGHINGYYNKVGDALYTPDNNTTWQYIEDHATQTDVTVLGKYIALQFPLLDENAFNQKGLGSYFNELVNVEDCINEWDNVMLWERLVMGILDEETIQANAKKSPYSDKDYVFEYTGNDTDGYGSDYSEYYNVHGLSFGTEGGYMYGGWDHCGYNTSTMGGVIQKLPTSSGAHWGPGHEIGHQHQGPLNMRGLTEVTNNLFSNIVLWYFGETTSRYNGDNGDLNNVLTQFNTEGADFFSNNIWAQTIMYYKLFLYYHVLGHNPKFYPRLFEMLRQDPMVIEYNQDGGKSLMHFYKKCCYAAGEDLTEFFRAHGFFEVMENRFVGDYSNAVYNLTQEQIDAAINEIKTWAAANNKKENIAVLFINDATGETITSHKGDNLETYGGTTICAEVGSYATFNDNVPGNYSYTVDGSTVTLEGTGGVGFVLLNSEGEIIGFSDSKSFTLSTEAMQSLINGETSIATISADGTVTAATATVDPSLSLLKGLMEQADAITALSDDTQMKVGYYKSDYLEDMNTAYTTAKGVYDAYNIAAAPSAYDMLKAALDELAANPYARVTMKPGKYTLKNYAYPARYMSINSDVLYTITSEPSSDTDKWIFEDGGNEGFYYIKNAGTGKYLTSIEKSARFSATGTTLPDDDNNIEDGEAVLYKLVDIGNGRWAFTCQGGEKLSLHCAANDSYYIVGWGSEASASQWYLTAETMDADALADANLSDMIAQTEDLMDQLAAYNAIGGELKMQVSDPKKTAYLSCYRLYDGGGGDSDTDCADLLDGDETTYIHTKYNADESDFPHYLQVAFGENGGPAQFKFSYRTRSENGNQAPKHIVVKGSNDLSEEFTQIAEFTSTDANNPLPTTGNTEWTATDNITSGYRYLRFYVTESPQEKPYFVMSEFGILCESGLLSEYSSCEDAYNNAYSVLVEASVIYNTSSATTETKTTAYNKLLDAYNTLKTAAENAENTNLDTYRTQLQALINETDLLIKDCGTVTANGNPNVTRQATDASADGYLVCNAPYTVSGTDYSPNCSKLLDGNTDTFFHSDYKNYWSDNHYLRVYSASGVGAFTFTYATRFGGTNIYYGHPSEIVVEGCNTADGTYTEIATLTAANDGLPQGGTTDAAQWFTSNTLNEGGNTYNYIRFRITKTQNPDYSINNSTQAFFYMSEFGVTKVQDDYTVELVDGIAESSDVTEEILLATWKEMQDATLDKQYATTEEALLNAISDLEYQKNVLANALEAVDKSALEALITNTNTTIESFYDDEQNFKYEGSLYVTAEQVGAAKLSLAEAQEVYNDAGATATDCSNAYATLEPVYKEMVYALSHATLPVMVTTDVENPTLYKIRIKRTATSLLELTSNNYIAVNDNVYTGDKNQTWLFMDNADKDGKVLILPYSKVAVTKTYINLSTDKNASSTSWRNTYSSNVYEGLTFATTVNNMKSQGGVLTIASGQNHPCTWTLTAPSGYLIQSYGFKFYNYDSAASDITLTPAGQSTYTSSNNEQTLTVNNVNAGSTTIVHDGTNQEIVLKDFYVNLVPTESMLVLAANDLSNGADKVTAVAKDSDGYAQEWTISASEGSGCEGWFYISTTKDATTGYFSNNGGVTRWMGFWNFGNDKADGGSNFQFVEVENSDFDNEAYNALYNYYTYDAKIESSEIVGGSNPGYYPTAQANAYNTAYAAATSALEAEPSVEADCYAAYAALKAANEDADFTIQLPQEGKYYTLNSVLHTGKKMYASLDKATENQLKFNSGMENKPEAIWSVSSVNNTNNSFHLTNLQTGASLTNAVTWGGQYALGEEARMVTIQSASLDGKIILIPQGGHPLHASNGNIIGWDAYTSDSYSAWTFEEVENMSNVTFPISVTKYGYAGLHLNYPVEVADGLEAYVVQEVTGEDGVARLTLLEDGIIPANTGVIVKSQEAKDAGETKEYTLNYYDTDATVDNLLDGRNYTQFVKAEPETDYYLFGVKNDEVGLYKAYEEYNSSGTTSLVQVLEQGGTLNGVYPIPGNTYYLRNKHMKGDVRFAVKNGAIEFNTDAENKNDDAFRWACIQPATSADALNALASATEIQIRNISDTNIYYFCGNKNVASGDDAENVFIWEPAGDSKFYLKKKNPTAEQGDGYMQQSAPSAFGAQATAQKFQAVFATPTDNGLNETADGVNLVRFKCVDTNTGKWINCKATTDTPVYNAGEGSWTMHNVYLVGAETTYAFRNVATNKYFGWQSLSDNPVAWNLYDTQQVAGNQGLQDGCVSMKKVDGKYLVVKNASGWDQADRDGFYNDTFSSSFYFEKFGNSNSYSNNVTSTSKTNDGGYFKCSANKIFLGYRATAGASKFLFRFDGGVTTDLEEALFGNDSKEEAIYDLQGRRVERITAPGLYIVNGKKRYIKAAKF